MFEQTVKVRRSGDTLVVTIPSTIRDLFGVKLGDSATFVVDNHKISLSFIPKQKRFRSILKAIETDNGVLRPVYHQDPNFQSTRFEFIGQWGFSGLEGFSYSLHYDHKTQKFLYFQCGNKPEDIWWGGYITKKIAQKIMNVTKISDFPKIAIQH